MSVETFCALRLFIDSWRWAGVPWYLRSGKLLPCTASEVLVRVGQHFIGDQRELDHCDVAAGADLTYERLLGDAMSGDDALFTSQDAVEAAWAVVDPVLVSHHVTLPYVPGTWGPKQADALIAGDAGWHNPAPARECA